MRYREPVVRLGPRMLIRGHSMRGKYLELYRPSSRAGRAYALATRVGIWPLSKRAAPAQVVRGAIQLLESCAPARISGFSSSTSGRWVFSLVRDESSAWVVKAGPITDVSLAREISWYRSMPPLLRDLCPSPALCFTTDSILVLALPYVQGDLGIRDGSPLELVLRLEASGVSHGDLAPWNMISAASVKVIDWERWSSLRSPGFDLIHYVIKMRSLQSRVPPSCAAAVLSHEDGPLGEYIHASGVSATPRDLIESYVAEAASLDVSDFAQEYRNGVVEWLRAK
jgi:hypothetical protein